MKRQLFLIICSLVFLPFVMNAQDLTPIAVNFNYDFQNALITNLSVDIENLDNFSVTDDFDVEVRIEGIGVVSCVGATASYDWFNDPSIGGGSTYTMSISDIDLDQIDNNCGLPTGTYHLKVNVDINDEVSEANENNNIASFTNDSFDFESLVGIEDEVELPFNVYPNPVVSNLQIEIPEGHTSFEFQLVGLDGKVIKQQSLAAGQGEVSLNLETVEEGMYFYRIIGEERVAQSGKLVVIR